MAENLRDPWRSLALDGVGDLLVEARPGFVVATDARHLVFANTAGRRFLGLAPKAPLDTASLEPRLAERLMRFAESATAGTTTRELLRVRDGLKTSLLALAFRRPVADGPIVVLVETAAPVAADARAEANLATLVDEGGMVALFDGHGDVVAAQGDHGAVEGLDEELERVLDDAEIAPVVERDVAAPGGRRPLALVTLGTAPDARRLLWVGPLTAAEPAATEAAATPAVATAETMEPAAPGVSIDAPAAPMAEAPIAPEADAQPVASRADAALAAPAAEPLPPLEALCEDTVVEDVFTEGDFDDAPFIAAIPLALDAWDEMGESDAAWVAHVAPAPEPAAPAPRHDVAAPLLETLSALLPQAAAVTEAEPAPAQIVAPAPVASTPDVAATAPIAEAVANTEAAMPAPAAAIPIVAEAAPEAAPMAATDHDGFAFEPPGRAVKFVWLMDADRRFTLVSPELAQVVGPAVTRLVGRSWSEVAQELGFDGDGVIAEALARRDTWSGRTVLWPVEGEALRVPVDLAALPAFDRGRIFAGFRGFGTCRADEPVPDPTAAGLRLRGHAEEPVASATVPALPSPSADVIAPVAAEEAAAEPAAEIAAASVATEAAAAPSTPAPIASAPAEEPAVYPDDTETALLADHADAAIDETHEAAFAGEITDVPSPAEIAAEAVASASAVHPVVPALPADVAEAVEALAPIVAPVAPTTIDIPVEPVAPAATPEAPAATPAPTTPSTPTRVATRTVADTAAIAAAVAAFTAAGAPKTGPARADAPLAPRPATVPAAPRAPAGEATAPAATPAQIAADNPRLSQPERVAFRQIAEALGARIEGEPAPAPAPVEATPAAPVESTAETVAAPAPEQPVPAITPEPEPIAPVIAAVETPAAAPERPAAVEETPIAPVPAPAALIESTTPTEPTVAAAPAAPEPSAAGVAATEAPAPRTAEPAAAPTPRPVDSRLLDRLPLAVAVIRDDVLAYANDRFLGLLRYPDLATLEAAGGLDSLFAGEHVARRWEAGQSGRPMPLIASDGTLVPADANLTTIPWADGSALMLTLNEVAPILAAPPAPLATPAPVVTEPPVVVPAAPAPVGAEAAAPATSTPSNVVALPTPALAVVASGPSSDAERIGELEAIVDTATDGVLMLDADGIVLSANTAAEALFGTERRAMIGRSLAERLAPESRRSAMDYLDGLARNGVASVLNDGREIIGVVQPEGLIPLFMTIGNISAGPVKKYCAVLRDITQWKKAEEDLTTARRRAEEASVHKSDFLAKISHEIRTPLNAIIGFSELMMDERFGPVGNDRYKDYLRDIHVSGTHIMSLVNDLLDLSKVEAGKMDLRFEAVTLADIVSECVAMMQPQANRERIIIRSSLPVGVPPVVADPRSVRQVVLNLLSNAIKFTPAGGQVIVSTTLEDNGEVVMRVRDTGYGMTDKEMQTAMEPFRQLHTTRSRGGGTGLGLPLTKALVEANRAVFRIDSTVGQGTLVSIAFPVTRVLAS